MKSHMEIDVRLGNITEQPDVDAIVTPSTDRLILTGAVGGEILRICGVQLDRDAQNKGPVKLGEAVATGPGALPNLYVIHAAIIGTDANALQVPTEWDSRTSGDVVGAAVLNSLQQAEQLGLTSIAFPPMGVELAGFPLDRCAGVMLDQIQAWATVKPNGPVQRVVIVCPSEREFQEFDKRIVRRMAS